MGAKTSQVLVGRHSYYLCHFHKAVVDKGPILQYDNHCVSCGLKFEIAYLDIKLCTDCAFKRNKQCAACFGQVV